MFSPLHKPEVPDAGKDDTPCDVAEMRRGRCTMRLPNSVRDTLVDYEHRWHGEMSRRCVFSGWREAR